jgi:hypothetical protein
VQDAAKRYLDASRLQIVAVANADTADILRKYGSLAIYDTDGRKTGSE